MYETKVYQRLANLISAHSTTGDPNWKDLHEESIEALARDHLPRGSGFDGACLVVFQDGNHNRIKIESAYHAMNENGYYSGWVYFDVIITPDLVTGFHLELENVNDNTDLQYWDDEIEAPVDVSAEEDGLLDYIADVFYTALSETISVGV